MFESCLEKQKQIKELFATCSSDDAKYQKLMELGRNQQPLSPEEKIPSNLVRGCQSQLYLSSKLEGDHVVFQAESDALISSGLAALLISVYSGETPETILKCPPAYLDELGINASLSPNRANGLHSLHLRMKQDALKLMIKKSEDGKKSGNQV